MAALLLIRSSQLCGEPCGAVAAVDPDAVERVQALPRAGKARRRRDGPVIAGRADLGDDFGVAATGRACADVQEEHPRPTLRAQDRQRRGESLEIAGAE